MRPKPEPLPAANRVLENPEPGRYGICCSGGGIRSAAFNLGALQVLQTDEARVLQRANYLAAVSGGSYIAAGFATVNKSGGPGDSDPDLIDEMPPFDRGSPEEQYLRNRSSYMAPGVSGKAALLGRVLLGVLVNLALIGSLLFVLGALAGWIYGLVHPGLLEEGGSAETGEIAKLPLVLVAIAAIGGLVAVLIPRGYEVAVRRAQGWSSRVLVGAGIAAVGLVALPELLEWLREAPAEDGSEVKGTKTDAVAVGVGGIATIIAGALLQLRARIMETRILRQAVDSSRTGARGFIESRIWPRVKPALVLIAATAAGPVLLGGFFVMAVLYALVYRDGGADLIPVAVAAGFLVLFFSMGDVTNWSLHPFYKQRLSSAFALRRVRGDLGAHESRIVAEARPPDAEVKLSEASVEAGVDDPRHEWPLLLVCAAANVSDPGATPPGRAVTTLTFSPREIGGPLVGFVDTKLYERTLGDRARDVTLPAAVAVSGAALAPSMGKMTRLPFRFLLALANVRLGVWLPNPQRIDECEHARQQGGWRRLRWKPGPTSLLRELIGKNSLGARFIYVTDGGHYENLGLVELLRRGCRDVYCFDASGGADTQELGDAIALARSELQVEITINTEDVEPDPGTGIAATTCKTGCIRYPNGSEGRLVYVRSVLTADAPHDVASYHEIDPAFPHNSTGDQLYTDQRFEAYRALGGAAATEALRLFRPPLVTPAASRQREGRFTHAQEVRS